MVKVIVENDVLWHVYSLRAIVLITAMLGIRSNFRFKRIIAYSMRTKSSTSTAIVNRLSYFKEMNIILTCVLFIYGACFVILCADGLTEGKTINTNKFACDLLIANVNMCVIVLWLLFVSSLILDVMADIDT